MVACPLWMSISRSDSAEVRLVLDKQLVKPQYYGKTLLQFAWRHHLIKPYVSDYKVKSKTRHAGDRDTFAMAGRLLHTYFHE